MLSFSLGSEAESRALAADVAALLLPGECVCLLGDLGAGKSFLARAMIRYLAHAPELEVPSPTYTLVQTYETPRMAVHHADFYRLSSSEEAEELGLFDDAAACQIIEWPQNAEAVLPENRLTIELEVTGETVRTVSLTSSSQNWQERLSRLEAKRAFLASAGLACPTRVPMQGDCSTRIYERLVEADGSIKILMDAPPKPDPGQTGAPPYSRIAHLAEDMRPFVAIGDGLLKAGFSTPEIFKADVEQGFLLLEDLGQDGVLQDGRPSPERYSKSVEVLARLHQMDWSQPLPVRGEGPYLLPPFDVEAMLAEVALLPQWYVPHMGGSLSEDGEQEFFRIWRDLATDLQELPQTLVLRDYHSPNILWCAAREGLRKIGIIDFQDALYGPEAYDLASVCQDARVFVPVNLEKQLLSQYLELRHDDEGFDPFALHASYRVMGAQRATKVLGIFARLAKRDGKPGHLNKLPIVRDYLKRNLEHPKLEVLADWHQRHLPLEDV